jgi:hypothetical protein
VVSLHCALAAATVLQWRLNDNSSRRWVKRVRNKRSDVLTPQEHNKYLAFSHIAYGSLMCLMSIFMTGFFIAMTRLGPDGPPAVFMVLMGLFFLGIYGLMTAPSFVAAYGLLKGRKWARMAAIIGGVTSAMNFPIGTAVCVYTFWFLFSEPGKVLFEEQQYALPPGQQVWTTGDVSQHQHRTEYTPPPTPPDWR